MASFSLADVTKADPGGSSRPGWYRRFPRPSATVALLLILVVVGLAVFPFYWMVVTATTPDSTLYSNSVQLVPHFESLRIFADVFHEKDVLLWLRNSAVIATGTMVGSVLLAVPMAYGLSRFRFRGKVIVGLGLFMTQMLPEALFVVPIFSLFSRLGLLDKHLGLILANVAFALPIVTWIMKNAIDTVPVEIEEAARVDGANAIQILVSIVARITAPTMAAIAVVSFFQGWNEYVFALTFLSDVDLKPASVGLAGFVGELSTPVQSVMTVGILYTLPAVALYLMLQKYIIGGMAAGSVKG